MKPIRQHAVVIGGSMAGLLVARALSDFYEQVTIIERDSFPPMPQPRKGVPQARHPHLLLAHGGEVMEGFFPDILDELVVHGAHEGDTDNLLLYQNGGYLCRFRMGFRTLSLSRSLLETTVRQRVLALPNIRAIQNCAALGLTATDDNSRITGVRIIRRDIDSAEENLTADLVVDAGGRGSRIIDWLAGMGYAPPEETKLHVDIVYTSRLYRRQSHHLPGLETVLISPSPQNPRGGVIMSRENDEWHVAVFGYMGDRPPLDEQGFQEFARTLPSPEVHNLVCAAEPLTEPMQYRFAYSHRRYYERLSSFPDGLLVIGDALCSFNPIYGQGMTIAALEALALHNCLSVGTQELASRFFKAAEELINNAWEISVGGDLKIPQVAGKRSVKVRFSNWYMDKLVKVAQSSPAVTRSFYDVIDFRSPPASLMYSRIALRVLWGHLRSRRANASPSHNPAPTGFSGTKGVVE
jgi:2-polyprenyl-6-methoxyphenol hydroxylase-like FAD-dependent oxidoreductase